MQNILTQIKHKIGTTINGNRNAMIDQKIAENVNYYKLESEAVVKERIKDLEAEWDVERTVELNASLVILTGVILAATVSRKWLMLPAFIAAYFTQHALQNSSAHLALFKNLRTRKEIAKEVYGLHTVLKDGPLKGQD